MLEAHLGLSVTLNSEHILVWKFPITQEAFYLPKCLLPILLVKGGVNCDPIESHCEDRRAQEVWYVPKEVSFLLYLCFFADY